MLLALLATKAMPRKTHIVPRVTMNGCTWSRTTSNPLISPHSRPMPRQAPMPAATADAVPAGGIRCSSMAVATPLSA